MKKKLEKIHELLMDVGLAEEQADRLIGRVTHLVATNQADVEVAALEAQIQAVRKAKRDAAEAERPKSKRERDIQQ
jgi:hypothetical protein